MDCRLFGPCGLDAKSFSTIVFYGKLILLMGDPSLPTPAAARQMLYRERRRHGLRCTQIEVRQSEIQALIQRGLLRQGAASDPLAVRDAIHRHLDQTLSRPGSVI